MNNRGKTWLLGVVVIAVGCASEDFSSGSGGQTGAHAGGGSGGAGLGGSAGSSGGAAGSSGGAAGATGGTAGAMGGAAGAMGGAAGASAGAAGASGGAAGASGGDAGAIGGAAGSSGGAAGGGTGGSAGASGGAGGSGGLPNVACTTPLPGAGLECCTSPTLTTVAWNDARAHCQSLGLSLAKVEDSAKNQIIAAVFPNANMWIGLSDIQIETKFVWVDGAPLGTFNDWATLLGEPDSKAPSGHVGQNCVFVSNTGKWFDTNCAGGGIYPVKGWCCE